ncbi:unnamed protein product [Effrenium voratum]|uniref:Uncharacterized protein n=1 Tax=Effrenium voratum TaxID=2562239 RepID=A0AA36MRE1_9DINO|nr:unnamed protein product [Effrenium voratum]CAJ1419268.1 unnamed protein product [Effrenium voratum]
MSKICAQRTDFDGGWGLDLVLDCRSNGGGGFGGSGSNSGSGSGGSGSGGGAVAFTTSCEIKGFIPTVIQGNLPLMGG